ncbi:MAG: hypothetical protein ACI4VG_04520 [Lachnospiraceae bacterium]
MSENIKYEKGLVATTITQLEGQIQELLVNKAEEYDSLKTIFANSRGEMTEELQEYLMKEKQSILELAEFYRRILEVIHRASHDLDSIEERYGEARVQKEGGQR